MRAKEFDIKKRDPNWRAMQDIRRSGAGGQHKDKKKAEKQGEVKHKGRMAEGSGNNDNNDFYSGLYAELLGDVNNYSVTDMVNTKNSIKRALESGRLSLADVKSEIHQLESELKKQGMAEGEKQVYKVIAVDKSNALGKKVKLNVKANSIDEVFERLAMSDWYPLSINGEEVIDGRRLKKGVSEGADELYGLRIGDTVTTKINGEKVQGDIIDLFPDDMEVELLLKGAESGRTVVVDVRDTEFFEDTDSDEPDEQYLDKVISDLHKDALGFRPDQEFGREWMQSSFEEKLEIYNNLLKSLHSDIDEGIGRSPEVGDKIEWSTMRNSTPQKGTVASVENGVAKVQVGLGDNAKGFKIQRIPLMAKNVSWKIVSSPAKSKFEAWQEMPFGSVNVVTPAEQRQKYKKFVQDLVADGVSEKTAYEALDLVRDEVMRGARWDDAVEVALRQYGIDDPYRLEREKEREQEYNADQDRVRQQTVKTLQNFYKQVRQRQGRERAQAIARLRDIWNQGTPEEQAEADRMFGDDPQWQQIKSKLVMKSKTTKVDNDMDEGIGGMIAGGVGQFIGNKIDPLAGEIMRAHGEIAGRKAEYTIRKYMNLLQKALKQQLDSGGKSNEGMQEGSYTTEKQILTRIRQIMYDRKLSGTESNAGELNRLKQQLKDIRSQQGVSEDSDFGEPKEILEDVLRTLEREVEWPLTDVMDPREVKQLLAPIVKAVNDKMMSMEEGRRDYGYDSFGNSLRPGSDEGSTEPPNNFAIYINGKKWKVFQGKGQYADDQYEMQQFRQLQAMAARKSQETGKKWEVARTGEPATK
jgi:hypothetical protein